jgi:hypothetical protein
VTVESVTVARTRRLDKLATTLARMSPKKVTPYDDLNAECRRQADEDGVTPVGAVEIAEWFGVTRNTVDQWRLAEPKDPERLFPPPTWVAGGRPVWATQVIEEWGIRTGRLSR